MDKPPESGERYARIGGGVNVHFEPEVSKEGIVRLKEFMCRCGPQEKDGFVEAWDKEEEKRVVTGEPFVPSEGQQHCTDVLAEVKERLKADDTTLVSHIITSLNWDYEAHVTSIENDQWSGIGAETYSVQSPRLGEPALKTYVECDRVEDGLAMTWKLFADNIPSNDALIYSEAEKPVEDDGP